MVFDLTVLTSAPLFLLLITAPIYRAARRRAVRRATDLQRAHARPPVLYLRSFGDDSITMWARATNGRSWLEAVRPVRFEEVVVDHLFRYGPVVAIGQPGERTPPLGAARDYVVGEGWQLRVEQLMEQAILIVVVAGRTQGLAWELGRLAERGLLGKLVVLLPTEPDVRERWTHVCDRLTGTVFARASQALDVRGARAVLLQPGGVAVALAAEDRDDWSYEVALDAAAGLVTGMVSPGATPDAHQASGWTTAADLAEARLAGVPTPATDRLGRAVGGLILTLLMGCGMGVVAMVLGAALADLHQTGRGLLGVALSAGLVSGVSWLVTARWLPAIGVRERGLGALLATGLPVAFSLSIGGGWWASMLYGSYVALTRDRAKQPVRRSTDALTTSGMRTA